MRSDWIYLMLLLAGSACGAEVFRSVDADGNVTYSDRADSQDVETIFINTSTATPSAANEPTADNTPSADDAPAEDGEADEDAYVEPTDEEIAAQRTENCSISRDRQERYSIAHRIYRETEGGGREYLNTSELDEIRTQATTDVDEWCN